MSESKPNASAVLERLSSSYGVTTQKELSVCLEIPAGNVSAWMQRGSVPGNAIIKCALDTGADLKWLVTGVFANANINKTNTSKSTKIVRGKSLLKKMLSAGGKAVLKRVLDAYGFTTQKELSEYLEISTGTISTWVRREYFPGDVVITCSLDTGFSLEWLATGEMNNESQKEPVTSGIPMISKKILLAGKLDDDGFCYIDESFIPEEVIFKDLNYVRSGKSAWLIDMGVNKLSNGLWLLDIDGTLDVYSVSKRPGNKIRITGQDGEFECLTDEVAAKGLVVVILKNAL
ncbi:helix-turn-helix domain-containing protein [Rahnella variigena]|uniref:helix-turn-helix domain-containing protein n=1 Tax=Rahnella variigena TaxID=574964 RepID=UPI003D2C2A97